MKVFQTEKNIELRKDTSCSSAYYLVVVVVVLSGHFGTPLSAQISSGLFRHSNSSLSYKPNYLHFDVQSEDNAPKKDTVPKPKSVMIQSLLIPGWGQVTNKQWWKVPFVYGAILGVGYYSYWLHGQYTDFRAAYYNSFATTNPAYTDLRYGPTPERLIGVNSSALLNFRDYYRNQRDLMVVVTVMMYGLNAVDAYIFAHLRDFDVSDNFVARVEPRPVQGQWLSHVTVVVKF